MVSSQGLPGSRTDRKRKAPRPRRGAGPKARGACSSSKLRSRRAAGRFPDPPRGFCRRPHVAAPPAGDQLRSFRLSADILPLLRSATSSKPTFRSEEHTSELQSLMRSSYADFCLQKKILSSTTNGLLLQLKT